MSGWAPVTYWYVGISIIVNFLFVIVIIIGGAFDLRHLLKCLKEEVVDETDDGRVIRRSKDL